LFLTTYNKRKKAIIPKRKKSKETRETQGKEAAAAAAAAALQERRETKRVKNDDTKTNIGATTITNADQNDEELRYYQ
jgi:hypothetical protein